MTCCKTTPACCTSEEIDDVMYDARAGDLESLKAFLDSRPASCLASIRDEYSLATPLHYAAANGHLAIVEYLLELIKKDPASNGGVLKATNEGGNIALHWAALNGHLAIVTALCEAGSDPFMKNNADHDSYYEAESNEHEEVVDYLLKKFDIEPVELEADEEAAIEAAEASRVEGSDEVVATSIEQAVEDIKKLSV